MVDSLFLFWSTRDNRYEEVTTSRATSTSFRPPRGDEHTVAAAGGAFIKLWEMSNLGADSGKTTERERLLRVFNGLSIIVIGGVRVCWLLCCNFHWKTIKTISNQLRL